MNLTGTQLSNVEQRRLFAALDLAAAAAETAQAAERQALKHLQQARRLKRQARRERRLAAIFEAAAEDVAQAARTRSPRARGR